MPRATSSPSSRRAPRGTLPGQTHVTGPGGLSAAEFAAWYRSRTLEQWESLDIAAVARVAAEVVRAQERGRQVFVIGNGGSAATASHIATDLSKTAANGRDPLLRCLSLTDNVPFMTAIGNDLGYDQLFSRQLENLLRPGDLVVLVTGSGNSPNLLAAARLARRRRAFTVALLGFDGGKLKSLVDLAVLISSDQYGVIEDLHMGIGHVLTFFLKQRRRR